MEWRHYNVLRASLWSIEKLLHEMELSLEGRGSIFEHMDVDFTPAQIRAFREQFEQSYQLMRRIQKTFKLKDEPIRASIIFQGHLYFIQETIDETRPSSMEKGSGAIDSEDEKEKIDRYLDELSLHAKEIKKIMKMRL